jgi:hypothetical protein
VVYNPEYEDLEIMYPLFLQEGMMHFCILIKYTLYIHPLHMQEVKEDEDLPETFPTGL